MARSLLVVALAGLALSGCASSDSPGSGTALKSSDVTGEWSEKDSKPLVDLTFAEDGTASGSDGCNTMNGPWKIDGSTVELGPFAATMMACDGVDTWLSGASSATIDGDTMTILDDKGTSIGTLDKTS